MRNRRDPSRRPTSGEGGPYKPKVTINLAPAAFLQDSRHYRVYN